MHLKCKFLSISAKLKMEMKVVHPATNKSTCFLFPLTSYFKRESEFEGSNKRSALKRGQEATGSALPGAQKQMTLPCLITIQNFKVKNPFTASRVWACCCTSLTEFLFCCQSSTKGKMVEMFSNDHYQQLSKSAFKQTGFNRCPVCHCRSRVCQTLRESYEKKNIIQARIYLISWAISL